MDTLHFALPRLTQAGPASVAGNCTVAFPRASTDAQPPSPIQTPSQRRPGDSLQVPTARPPTTSSRWSVLPLLLPVEDDGEVLTGRSWDTLQADSSVTDPQVAADLKKKRTFRTFSYRGVELDKLLDLSNEEVRTQDIYSSRLILILIIAQFVEVCPNAQYKPSNIPHPTPFPSCRRSSMRVPAGGSSAASSASPWA